MRFSFSWNDLRPAVAVFLGMVAFFLLVNIPFFVKQIRFTFSSSAFVQTTSTESMATSTKTTLPVCKTPHQLFIPRLDIHAPIIFATVSEENHFQRALQDGVVHFPGTAMPGELGNAYIFGHSSDYPWSFGSFKTVFALLPKITMDDVIEITDTYGQTLSFRVIETKIVSPKDLSVLNQREHKDALLTLQTSYPLGTALQRFIVVSKLVQPPAPCAQ